MPQLSQKSKLIGRTQGRGTATADLETGEMKFFLALWQTALFFADLQCADLNPSLNLTTGELERVIHSPMIPVDRFLSLSVSNPLLLSATHAFLLIWGGPASLAKDFVHVS